MSDGWRGTKLGYAGGRTGYFANYGNNDALRGTRGLGSNHGGNTRNQQIMMTVVTGICLLGAFYVAQEYKFFKKTTKKLKKAGKNVADMIS